MNRTILLTGLCAFLLPARVPAAPHYAIQDLGTMGTTDPCTFAYAVNNSGQVAGYSGRPFLWSSGSMTPLNPSLPNSLWAFAPARDVNDAGVVVGSFSAPAVVGSGTSANNTYSAVHPYKWAGSVFTDLAPTATDARRAVAINNLGDIVIAGYRDVLGVSGSYILRADGTTVPLPGFTDGTSLTPSDINDAGQVAGVAVTAAGDDHAALYEAGATLDLGALPGDTNSAAKAINASGTVVGCSYGPATTSPARGFVWSGGQMTPLPSRAAGESCVARAINAAGIIVGYVGSEPNLGNETGALVWTNGEVADLQTLIPSGSGWTLQAAEAVNDAGQIAGYGLVSATVHAFLLTPVRVPGDADGDGTVSVADGAIVLAMSGGLTLVSSIPDLDLAPKPSPDARGYGDGALTMADALRILRKAAGLEEVWP